MIHFNENLRNWLLGKSEIDDECSAVPPPVTETPDQLIGQLQKVQNKAELAIINRKLSKMGYEIKTVHVVKKKSQ